MALATRTIGGNNSGLLPRKPKIVIMHATRSTRVSFTDAQELGATINWFLNPNGTSAQWVISKAERVRAVADALIAWHAGWEANRKSWAIEVTQPTIDRTFGKGHYDNLALIGRHYVRMGVAPVWLGYWDGNLTQSGFVDHEDTVWGRASGKSDIGYRFDRARFIASLSERKDDVAFIQAPNGHLFLTDGVFKNHIPSGFQRINDAKKVFGEPIKVGAAFVADLRTSNPILSADDIAKIVRKELDKATKAV